MTKTKEKIVRYLKATRQIDFDLDEKNPQSHHDLVFEYSEKIAREQKLSLEAVLFRSPLKRIEVIEDIKTVFICYDISVRDMFNLLNEVYFSTSYNADRAMAFSFNYLAESYLVAKQDVQAYFFAEAFQELNAKLTQIDDETSEEDLFQRTWTNTCYKAVQETFLIFHELYHQLLKNEKFLSRQKEIGKICEQYLDQDFTISNVWEGLKATINLDEIEGLQQDYKRNTSIEMELRPVIIEEMICDYLAIRETFSFFIDKEKLFMLHGSNEAILLALFHSRWLLDLQDILNRDDKAKLGKEFIHAYIRVHWIRESLSTLMKENGSMREFFIFPTSSIAQKHNSIFLNSKGLLADLNKLAKSFDEASVRRDLGERISKDNIQNMLKWH